MKRSRILLRVFAFIFLTVGLGVAQEKKEESVDTPHGKIEWKTTTYDKKDTDKVISVVVREMTPEELQKLDSDADRATGFIERYVPEPKRDKDLLENLDLAFAAWMVSAEPGKESDKDVIQIVGSAFGRYCISRLGLHWAVIKDELGTAVALVREKPTTRSYPFSSIQYRIEDKKVDFIYALYVTLKHSIDGPK